MTVLKLSVGDNNDTRLRASSAWASVVFLLGTPEPSRCKYLLLRNKERVVVTLEDDRYRFTHAEWFEVVFTYFENLAIDTSKICSGREENGKDSNALHDLYL